MLRLLRPRRLFGLLFAVALPASAGTITANPPNVNVRKVPSVKQAYRKLLATAKARPNWTGNVAAGNAGVVSIPYQQAILRSVNIFRALAGVKPVVFDTDLNAKCAQAALMMSANRTLNHFPPPSFTFYSADGAEAAGKSNLFLGFTGPFSIPGYMEDAGANNTIVGHRRWILWSQSQIMGSGNVFGGNSFPDANALWVIPTGPSPAPSARNGFVAWPYPGSIPNTLVFKRWSFSHPTANLTQATVRVTLNGRTIPVRIVDRDSAVGVGDRTIVFQPKGKYTAPDFRGTLLYQSHLKPPTRLATYEVTVANVDLGAGVKKTFRYRVKVFPM